MPNESLDETTSRSAAFFKRLGAAGQFNVVRSPAGYTPEQVDGVVASKRLWIYRNLAESPQPYGCLLE